MRYLNSYIGGFIITLNIIGYHSKVILIAINVSYICKLHPGGRGVFPKEIFSRNSDILSIGLLQLNSVHILHKLIWCHKQVIWLDHYLNGSSNHCLLSRPIYHLNLKNPTVLIVLHLWFLSMICKNLRTFFSIACQILFSFFNVKWLLW